MAQFEHLRSHRSQWASRSIIFGSIAAFSLAVLSIVYYPGGNRFFPEQVGYSFSGNFICDSFCPWTHGGRHNLIGSRLAVSGMLVFLWLSIFPAQALILNDWIADRRVRVTILTLALFSSAALSLLTISTWLQFSWHHDIFVWSAVIPSFLTTFLFIGAGFWLQLFPRWLQRMAGITIFLMVADLVLWVVRNALGMEPIPLEPILMKLTLFSICLLIASMAWLPQSLIRQGRLPVLGSGTVRS